jgi:BirA family biotin operon repressor/biotin-[acetyl-CoA-carboxylase] ligase
MMNPTERHLLSETLKPLKLGWWEYFPELGSTNDQALAWIKAGAPDWSLVVADSQTSGRGRNERRWVTRPGTGLAISLLLRLKDDETRTITRFTALAALGLITVLEQMGLQAQIKWPNDILLDGKKAAGILVEGEWSGDHLDGLVVGMGVNVSAGAVPDAETLRYPATSIENALGMPVNRWEILAGILKSMQSLRKTLVEDVFIDLWNDSLAFRGQRVLIKQHDQQAQEVKIIGIDREGALCIERADKEIRTIVTGEIIINEQGEN